MYSILKINHFAEPNHYKFCPTSNGSSASSLHMYYQLADLQREIEKRTFYLGKFRSTDQANHLLDLIGMSRDESDLLYSMAKDAMASVYDSFNKYTLAIDKKYDWHDNTGEGIIQVYKRPTCTLTSSDTNVTLGRVENNTRMSVSGTLASSTISDNDYYKEYCIPVNVTIAETNANTNATSTFTVKYNVVIKDTQLGASGAITPFNVHVMDIVPKERLNDGYSYTISANPTVSVSGITVEAYLKEPVAIPSGMVFAYYLNESDANPEVLISTVDTNSNKLDVSDTAHVRRYADPEIYTEGIHYFLDVPGFIDLTNVAPLDTAILEALVTYIMWKWLMMAFPDEAKTYEALYTKAIEEIKTRCNIFSKHWATVTPRVF